MGIHSNFDAVLVACKYGAKRTRIDGDTGDLTNGVAEDLDNEDRMIDALDARRGLSRMAATAKNRRVMSTYAMVHPMHQRILEAAYEPRQYPPEARQMLGDATGVAALTATARNTKRWSWDWLAAAVVRKDPRAMVIKREADAMLMAAHDAYGRAAGYVSTQTEPEPATAPATEPRRRQRKAQPEVHP